MFLKMNHLLFLMTLMLGSMIAVSTNSWFTSWLGLEINLLSIIPLILTQNKQTLTESSIKYFITQALASILLIALTAINFSSSEEMTLSLEQYLIFLALMLKMGVPPFHFWFPQIIMHMSWLQCFIMFTWQKLAPLILIAQLNFNLMTLGSIMAVTFGGLGGINQVKLKNMMTYSSIAHSGWLLAASSISSFHWMMYFSAYTLMTMIILVTTNFYVLSKINEINFKLNWTMKYMFTFNLLTLGGLPPFLGFMAKISILYPLLTSKAIILPSIMIIASLISLYFYTRMIYSSLMQKESFSPMKTYKLTSINLLSILGVFSNILIPVLAIIN